MKTILSITNAEGKQIPLIVDEIFDQLAKTAPYINHSEWNEINYVEADLNGHKIIVAKFFDGHHRSGVYTGYILSDERVHERSGNLFDLADRLLSKINYFKHETENIII